MRKVWEFEAYDTLGSVRNWWIACVVQILDEKCLLFYHHFLLFLLQLIAIKETQVLNLQRQAEIV